MHNIITSFVYHFSQEMPRLSQLLGYLDEAERERMAQFKFQALRDRYAISRGLLREKLAAYLQCLPENIIFKYNQHGKPQLENKAVHFNISHAEDVWVCVLASRPVGVDVEWCNRKVDFINLATRFFAKSEVALLHKTPEASRQDAFFRLWVAKEAVVKALGMGLLVELDQIEVGLDASDYQLLKTPENKKMVLNPLSSPVGYKAAVALLQ